MFAEKILWLISCVLFVTGSLLPMFSFNKFFIFNDTFSLMGGIIFLLRKGEVFLSLVVFSFSLLGPVYKLYLSGTLLKGKAIDREKRISIVKRLAIVGKWSMADVFVVAVIAATIKLGMFASVTIHSGLVVFSLAVLSSMLLIHKQMADYELRPRDENT